MIRLFVNNTIRRSDVYEIGFVYLMFHAVRGYFRNILEIQSENLSVWEVIEPTGTFNIEHQRLFVE